LDFNSKTETVAAMKEKKKGREKSFLNKNENVANG